MKILAALASLALAGPALAQFKCTAADGTVSFQQQPCPAGAAASKITLAAPGPSEERPAHVREALAKGRYVTGMNRRELDTVMGQPSSVTRSWVAGQWHEQLVYRYPGRTVYMYLTDGVLDSFQDSEHARAR